MPEAVDIGAKARDKVSNADVRDDVAALRADMEKLIQDVARLAQKRVHQGVEAPAKLKDAVDENINEVADKARDYVRENPLGACATAAAAGFALALLLRR
jgi:ElaB/YqjD/DUF883 family membrane-anchored ribosome-binding protein